MTPYEELLRKTDPKGYYVIPVRPGGSRVQVEEAARLHGALVEDAGDVMILRVRGRSRAKRLIAALARLGVDIGP